jgi:dTDP-4-dehydrorhamnose 3,5-epimerase
MELTPLPLEGCYELQPPVRRDSRGLFVKTYHAELFNKMDLNTDWNEEYYSLSQKHVLRGFHFQIPPYDHIKLVYCVTGEILDVLLDLRKDSPTFGEHCKIVVSSEKANMVYMPKGIAHGFLTLSDTATMAYKASTVYAPEHDTGVHWNSAAVEWSITEPIISERDAELPQFRIFESPFN